MPQAAGPLLARDVTSAQLYCNALVGEQADEISGVIEQAQQAIDQLTTAAARGAFGRDSFKQVPAAAGDNSAAIKATAMQLIRAMIPLMLIKAMMQLPSGNNSEKKKSNMHLFGANSFDQFLQKAWGELQPAAGSGSLPTADHAGAGSSSSSSSSSAAAVAAAAACALQ
jgi:hypothetical protein